MNSVLRMGLCIFSLVLVQSATAATWRYWRAVDGDYSGIWAEPGHWKGGNVPISDEVADFGPNVTMTVTVNQDTTCGYWYLDPIALTDEPHWITWAGAYTIKSAASTSVLVGNNRRLRIDGPYVDIYKYAQVGTNGILEVKSGTLYLRNQTLTLLAGSRLNLTGGFARIAVGTVEEGAKVCLSGGVWQMPGDYNIETDDFEWTGGTLRFVTKQLSTGALTQRYLPARGRVLDTRYSSINAFYVTESGTTNVIDGTLYVTNRLNGTTVSYPRYHAQKVSHRIAGAGTLVVDRFSIRGGSTMTMTVPKVCLGTGFYVENADTATFNFPDGMSFGSWGDWSNIPDPEIAVDDEIGHSPSVKLAKDVSFDTLDTLDGTTMRHVQLVKCVDNGLASLKAIGGGSVDLVFSDAIDGLRTLEVGANTTLYLTNSTVVARRLVLGANARLYVKYGSRLEMQKAPGAGAHVHFIGAPAADALQPCVSAYGAALPADFVQVESDVQSGWTMKNYEGVIYLHPNGFAPEPTYSEREWIGGTSSIWSDKSNWTGESVLSGAATGYFGRDLNPYVTNTSATLSYRYPIFLNTAGPYFIRGEKMTIRYGEAKDTGNSIRSASKFPVIFDTPLAFSIAGPNAYFRNVGSSYVQLGEMVTELKHIWVTGDIRFAGIWSCTNLTTIASSDYTPSVTVGKGGQLTLRAEGESFKAIADIMVDGVLDISNTLASASAASWWGTGVVKLRDLSMPAASGAFGLQDELTLYPERGWPTASAADPAVALTIAASDSPTLGATCDWTYGPTTGAAPTTTAAERALTVASRSTLTIDTADPVAATGHTITFKDPIMGEGNVVKKGTGALRLETGDSSIGGSFTVSGGTIELGTDLATAALTQWTRIFTAGSFSGLTTALSGDYKLRSVKTADGRLACEVKAYPGMMLIVR